MKIIIQLSLVLAIVATVAFLNVSLSNGQSASIIDAATNLELQLLEEDAPLPYASYWGIPCKQEGGHCVQYMQYGAFVGDSFKLRGQKDHKMIKQTTNSNINDSIMAIPGSTDIVLIDSKVWMYRNFLSNVTPRYDLFGMLSHYQLTKDYKSDDYALKYQDGTVVTGFKANGMSVSADGSTLVGNIGRHQVFVDTKTATARRFGENSIAPGYSSSRMKISLSLDGSLALLNNDDFSQVTLYDLSSCQSVDTVNPEQCNKRKISTLLKDSIPGYYELRSARFISNQQIEMSVVVYRDSVKKFNEYILRIPGSNNLKYLALGDSFASGEGAYSYKTTTNSSSNKCHLSFDSYPYLIKAELSQQPVESVACSGAKIKDIHQTGTHIMYKDNDPQGKGKDNVFYDNEIYSGFLPGYRRQNTFLDRYTPEVMTLSVGGNNINFGSKLVRCVFVLDSCYDSGREKTAILKEIKAQFDELTKLYSRLLEKSPRSRLYVIGYPQFALPGGSCGNNVRLSETELRLAEDIVADLNSVVELAAKKAGVFYVDVSDAFNGSRLCEGESQNLAFNGLALGNDSPFGSFGPFGNESYHPNKKGHQLYKTAILSKTNNLTTPMPAPDLTVNTDTMVSELTKNETVQNPDTIPIPTQHSVLSQDLQTAGNSLSQTIQTDGYYMKPGSTLRVELHSEPRVIGTATAQTMHDITIDAVLPSDVEPGFHTIHLYGTDVEGKPIDIYKDITVISSETDYDGDGIPNESDDCQFITPSGLDVDEDGVDDACDPEITEPPVEKDPPADPPVEGLKNQPSENAIKQLVKTVVLVAESMIVNFVVTITRLLTAPIKLLKLFI